MNGQNPNDYIEQVRAVIDAHGFDIQIFLVVSQPNHEF